MTLIDRRTVLASLAGAVGLGPVSPKLVVQTPSARASLSGTPLAERLADYAATLTFADLSADVIDAVKMRVVDALGCALAAWNDVPVRAVRNVALAAQGPATVIGAAQQSTVELAAFANAVAVRYLDFNDVYASRETGHPSDIVAGVLAVAESEQRSGQDVILALALAYEIDCHFLDAAQISARGWDHPNFILPAAALAAGVLMRLSQSHLTEAVNLAMSGHLAMYQTRSQTISHWKGMAAAEAVRAAVFAAQLARAGVTGPSPIFEGSAGFFRLVSGELAVDTGRFGRAGRRFKVLDCALKFYPAQTQTLTAIQAAMVLARQISDLKQIVAVDVETTQPGMLYAADSAEKWAPRSRETADHSMPYIVARAMVDGEITPRSFDPTQLQDERVRFLLDRTTVREDPTLTALYPERIPNRITVTLMDGRKLSEQVDELPGFAGMPMARSDVEDKFRRNARGLLRPAQQERFLELAWALDTQPAIDPCLAALQVEQR